MSKTVDQRVVEMQFDNKHFEKNVSTTMSTLEKLKQRLNFTGASKGLENLNSAAGKVNMSGLNSAIDGVGSRFSAMEVMGITALANITNSAVNAGKRILSALTIQPVKTGFNEYELKMDSIKTIMASTGESVDTVNKYLNELNEYSDQTIYSFSDMTQNIGKFTNAGVKLEDAVMAIKGISNEAAVSGANANEASRAMYNFAQALSAGYVKLIDWKSIENANMATVEFKQQLIDSAVAVGTLKKASNGMYQTLSGETLSATQNFNETLQEQWMTTDVLVSTLKDYADANTDIGKKAFAAAQDVTKLSQVFDILKETAQSGWSRTWEIVFGDIEQAKAIFTPMTEFLSGIIQGMDDFRNSILEGALSSPFEGLSKKLEAITGGVGGLENITGKLTRSTEEYENVVNEVIRGEWGKMHKRWDALTEAGYDWAKVQNMVNERMGYSKRHVSDYDKSLEDASKTQIKTIEDLLAMSDAQLKELDLTDKEIQALRELEKQSEKTGIPIKELAEDMDQLNGRTLLVNAFTNAGKALKAVLEAIGGAWTEIFPPEAASEALYNFIAAMHKASTYLEVTDDEAAKLKRTFKGVFAAIDIITTIVGGGFKLAFKIVGGLLGAFDTDILSVTAAVGDAVVGFRDWIDSILDFTKMFDGIAPALKNAAARFQDWIATLKDSENLPRDIITGLVKGLAEGVKLVWDAAMKVGETILESICNFLGIQSPSKEMIEVGKFTIQGLVEGLKDGLGSLWDTVKGIASKLAEYIKSIDYGTLFAAGISVGFLFFVKKISDTMSALTSPLSFMDDLSDVMGGLTKSLKASAISKLAFSIVLLAGAVAVLALINPWRLLSAVLAIGALAGIIIALSAAVDKFGPKESINMVKMGAALAAMSISLLVVAAAIKILSGVSGGDLTKGLLGVLGIVGIIALLSKTAKTYGKDIGGIGKTLIAMSIAMLLMLTVMKAMSKMDPETVAKGSVGILGMIAIFKMLTSATGTGNKVGGTLMAMSIAMLLLIGVAKLISGMTWGEMAKAAIGLLGFVGILAALMSVLRLDAGKDLSKVGGTLLAMSLSIGVLGLIAKLISGMSWTDMGKGAVGLLGLVGTLAGLMMMLNKLSGKDMPKVAATLIAMSVAIGILGAIAVILGFVDIGHLAKGIVAVGLLAAIMSGMIIATKYATQCKGELIVLTVAMGVMAAAIGILSLIDPSRLAASTAAMSLVMGMFAMIIKSTASMTSSLKSIIILTVAIGMVAGVLYLLSGLPIETTMTTTASLSLLLLSMAGAMGILSKTTTLSSKALVAMGVMTGVLLGIGLVLEMLKDLPVDNTLTNAAAVSTLLLSLAGVTAILSMIGPKAAMADAALLVMAKLIAGLTVVLLALGALSKIPGFNDIIAGGGETLALIGYALGNFVGSIVGGFSAGALSGLPKIGEYLSEFMDNLGGFLTGVESIKPESVEGVKALAETLLILTGANILESLTSWFTGGTSLADFAKQFVPFGEKMVEFSDVISGKIDEGAITAAANAGKMLAEMADAIPNTGGVVGWFTGENDISLFGSKLVLFGYAITNFSKVVSGNVDEGAITAAANAGKMMAEMAATIPNTGGVVGWFTGENDIDTFGTKLVSFGYAIRNFSAIVAGAIDEAAVEAASKAGSIMVELANKIPNTGGVVGWFTGDNDLATFGDRLVSFGRSMVDFSSVVAGNIDAEAVTAAAAAADTLATLENKLPKTGGIESWFDGDSSFDTFGENLRNLGLSLKNFSTTIMDANLEAVGNATTQVRYLVNLAKDMTGVDFSSFTTFSTALGDLGRSGIDSFAEAFDGAGAKVTTAINGMINNVIIGIGTKSSAISEAFTRMLDKLSQSIEGKHQAFKTAGEKMVEAMSTAINENAKKAKDEVVDMVERAGEAADDSYWDFYYAGEDMVDGFAAGISANTFKARAKATAMAEAALEAAKEVLKINSPSKVFISMGTSVPEGFAIGISRLGNMVMDSSNAMAEGAIDTVSSSITKIASMVGSDIDAQPTIRPVLDLSDVRAGAGAISGLLGAGSSVGVMANVGAINSMMRQNSQNGTNGDVVAAIDKLRSDLGNLGGDQYNVNGITYDDGSNVTSAVKSLVRAVKMDRRV